jgi:hypothetical protein
VTPRDESSNGAWRTWLLGIAATLLVTLITNGILFQRDTREQLSTNEERIKALETRARDAIIREFKQRDDAILRLEKRIEQLEQRAR